MCSSALFAHDPLDGERKQSCRRFHLTFVPSVENEAALLMAGALDSEQIDQIYEIIVGFLRKGLVRRKKKRYHNPVLCREAKAALQGEWTGSKLGKVLDPVCFYDPEITISQKVPASKSVTGKSQIF